MNKPIEAEGDLDFRGTLGISKEVPGGFQAIRLIVSLETNATRAGRTLLRLTERNCVVVQSFKRAPEIKVVRKE